MRASYHAKPFDACRQWYRARYTSAGAFSGLNYLGGRLIEDSVIECFQNYSNLLAVDHYYPFTYAGAILYRRRCFWGFFVCIELQGITCATLRKSPERAGVPETLT